MTQGLTPFFSIVIPCFNREREIGRAVGSCLAQEFPDFEIVVVDDGSTDGTARALREIADPRVRLVRLPSNRGHTAARNAGVRAARGEWIIHLDSDDELLPGALGRIHAHALAAPPDIHRLGFTYVRDDGRISPFPPHNDATHDYEQSVASMEGRVLYDFLACTRTSTRETVQWKERRCADHCLYGLDFALNFRTRFVPEPAALLHTDARVRVSQSRRNPTMALEFARELGEEMDEILARHGRALARHAPRTHRMFRRMRACYHFLAGARLKGLRHIAQCIREAPLSLDAWAIAALGMLSPRLLAAIRSARRPAT